MDKPISNISGSAKDSFRPHDREGRQQGRSHADANVYYVETDPGPLKKRLNKGDRIKSRIVLILDDERYLLRLFGYNFVMQSQLKFERGEEVMLCVDETDPRLKLQLQRHKENRAKPGSTDITV